MRFWEKAKLVVLLRLVGAIVLALLLLLLLSVASSAARLASTSHLSVQVTPIWLGNPVAGEEYSARHIWDLQAWQGRVYLGYGDWNYNLGPVRIWYYTHTAGIFVSETVYISETRPAALVDEEAIDRYVVIDGDLYIPGTDPVDSWNLGNFYRNDGTGWVKYRTIPLGIHAFDLASYDGELFVAIGSNGGAALLRSDDGGVGITWTSAISEVQPAGYLNRFYELYELGGTLFAVKSPTMTLPKPSVYRYQSPGFVTTTIDLVPDQASGLIFVRDDVFVFDDSILYIPWSRDTVTSCARPISALYQAHIWQDGQRVAFFDGKYPRDVVVVGEWVYVLDAGGSRCMVYEKLPDPAGYTATVYASTDLTSWVPVVTAHFTDTPSALEVLDGFAYVGTYNGDIYALPLHHIYLSFVRRE